MKPKGIYKSNKEHILKFLIGSILLVLSFFMSTLFAQETGGGLGGLELFLGPLLESLAGKYGIVVQVLTVIGSLRVVFKPLFSFLRAVAGETKTQKDDLFLDKVEGSKIYSSISWALDFIGSIKLPGSK